MQISIAKSSPASNSTAFIKAECRATLYPPLCIQSLSVHSSTIQQSPKQLAQAALSVSLTRAQTVSTFISKLVTTKGRLKPMEYRAQDCMANMGNTVDQHCPCVGSSIC